ncbi:hypothetical protein [Actinomadura geliboluensis]|uniref:Uncharacterized protein n=1 Tax=Actinomadura geliboluensis TaxID=882440 RepID=A0A5S4G5M4_9ACTN|nr:hypothetical protein [Actinomadura geliboluensis]TMR27721.1 hypothetical protein ETD96_38860 [Actinomadura geliboluensis]CNF13583.1 Uncharacterised protein [Mycobacterium tuberculosis]
MAAEDNQGRRADLAALMTQLEESMADVRGIDDFVGAGAAFIKGEEQDIEATVDQMMSFFNGEIGGHSTERQRLIQIAQCMRREAGGVAIFMLTFTTCSAALSCSYACC